MKKSKRLKITAVAAAVMLAGTVTVYASYDSSKDPVVSLSYLTDVFKPEVKGELSSEIKSSLKTELKNEIKSELKTAIKSEISSELKSSIKSEISSELKSSLKSELKSEISASLKSELKSELSTELQAEIKPSIKEEVIADLKGELKSELKNEIKTELGTSLKESLKSELYEELSVDMSATVEALQKQIDILSNEYEVITIEKGKKFTAKSACEILLLSGAMNVKCRAANEGIVDCTDGVILYDGQNVPVHHKLIVPDNGDSRGFAVTATTEILVKGGYTIG